MSRDTEFELLPFDAEAQDEWEAERSRAPQRGRPVPSRQRLPPPPHKGPHGRWPPSLWPTHAPAMPCVCPAHGTEYVRWIQSALNQVEGLHLPIDGVMSAATRNALRAFQSRQGLSADGIAGPDTEEALRRARGGAAPDTPTIEAGDPPASEVFEFQALEFEAPATGQPTLRRGSNGSVVTDLQQRLARAGFSPGLIDGIFGSQTDRAVRAFQQARGLMVDGVVGPQTWGVLLGGAATPPLPAPGSPSPVTGGTLRSRIAQAALQEWQRWGSGSINESDPHIRSILGDYWRVATGSVPATPAWWSGIAWSAVFISWVVAKAGAGRNFRYGNAHTSYVAAAKRNRLAGNTNPFKAYRIDEVAPQIGDLVCQERENSGVSYDNVDDGNSRASHSDIVVDVQPGKLTVIGGNVSNTVGRKTISTNPSSGRLNGRPYYAVIKVEA